MVVLSMGSLQRLASRYLRARGSLGAGQRQPCGVSPPRCHVPGTLGDTVHFRGLPCDSPQLHPCLGGLLAAASPLVVCNDPWNPAVWDLPAARCVRVAQGCRRPPDVANGLLCGALPVSRGQRHRLGNLQTTALLNRMRGGQWGVLWSAFSRAQQHRLAVSPCPLARLSTRGPFSGNIPAVITPLAATFSPKEKVPSVGPEVVTGHRFMHWLCSRSSGRPRGGGEGDTEKFVPQTGS